MGVGGYGGYSSGALRDREAPLLVIKSLSMASSKKKTPSVSN